MRKYFVILIAFLCWSRKTYACLTGGLLPLPELDDDPLHVALGGNIGSSSLSTGADGTAIAVDADLFCSTFDIFCKWKNTGKDQLEWDMGTGKADSTRWKLATGTNEQPDENFAVLSSNARNPSDKGYYISDPINCQVGVGPLTFRHWISKGNSLFDFERPKLKVCWRYVGELQTHDCQPVTGSPGSSTIIIPDVGEGPFEIVFEGSNFVQHPIGFIIIDDVNYIADVREQCDSYETVDDSQPASPEEDPDFDVPDDEYSCSLLSCPFDGPNDPCSLKLVGEGAVGPGKDNGWMITNGINNRANVLTGVKYDPNKSRQGYFAVADFPDPRQEYIVPGTQYVMESDPLVFSNQNRYLGFYRYMATEGTQLKLCGDPNGYDCFWESDPLVRGKTKASRNRRWIEETVKLPEGKYKVYTIASYDQRGVYNRGQIGLSNFQVYTDSSTRTPLC